MKLSRKMLLFITINIYCLHISDQGNVCYINIDVNIDVNID